MNNMIVVIALVLFGFASCAPDKYGKHHHDDYHAPAHYSFGYGVSDDYSGADFGHQESRDGYKTSGEYYVHLPDGRLQKVSYTADEYGYHPVVTYVGKAHFPSHSNGYH